MVAIWFVYSHKANNLRLGVRVEQDFLVDCTCPVYSKNTQDMHVAQ